MSLTLAECDSGWENIYWEGFYAEQDKKPREPPQNYSLAARRLWDKGWCAAADARAFAKLVLGEAESI